MYNFNLKRFICLLLLLKLRSNIIDFLAVLLTDIKNIHLRFLTFRERNLEALRYNAQYPSLQKLLNTLYDTQLKRIRVYDSLYSEPIIVYPQADEIPVLTLTEIAPNVLIPLIIYPSAEYNFSGFIVELPSDLHTPSNADKRKQITKTVDIYKFLGTKYKITYAS